MALLFRSRGALAFCALLALAGCAGSRATSSPVPLPVATAVPAAIVAPAATVVAAATPSTPEEQVAAACKGAAVPGAAPFGGSVHPLYVVVGGDVQRADQQRYSFNGAGERLAWLRAEWSSPLQLVVCVGSKDRVEIESCGSYMNNFGQSFEVRRYRLKTEVTIVEAATGRTQRTDTVLGPDPELCTQTVQAADLFGAVPDVYKFALTIAAG